MPPRRSSTVSTLYNVLLDSDIKSLALDTEGHVKTALAFHEDTNLTYLLRREWVKRLEPHKAQKNGWFVVQDFQGNCGVTSWSVGVATDTELENVAKASGHDLLYPQLYMITQKELFTSTVNFVKIGCSFTPHERLKTLQTGNPYKLTLHATFKTSTKRGDIQSMYSSERRVHKELANIGGPYSTATFTHQEAEAVNTFSEWFFVGDTNLGTIHATIERLLASVDSSLQHAETAVTAKRVHSEISEDSD